MEKIAALSVNRVSKSESSRVSVGKSLDALGRVSDPPSPAIKHSQWGECVTTWQYTVITKSKLRPRFAYGSTTPLYFTYLTGLLPL